MCPRWATAALVVLAFSSTVTAHICVECGRPLRQVYKMYGKESIRLSRCARCGCIADKYIEFEFVIIMIDVLLHKIEVYRHILFNRLPYCDSGIHRQLWKVLLALLLLDACNVGLIESHNASSAFAGSAAADAYPPGQLGEGAIDDRAAWFPALALASAIGNSSAPQHAAALGALASLGSREEATLPLGSTHDVSAKGRVVPLPGIPASALCALLPQDGALGQTCAVLPPHDLAARVGWDFKVVALLANVEVWQLHHAGLFLIAFSEFAVYCVAVILLAMLDANMNCRCGELVKHNYMIVALIISSFSRGVLMLMMVWDYPMSFLRVADFYVFTSNCVALNAYVDTTNFKTLLVILPAYALRLYVRGALFAEFHDLLLLTSYARAAS